MNGLVEALKTGCLVLTDEELSQAYKILSDEYLVRRERREKATKRQLVVGQDVKFFHSEKGDIHGTIRKVKYKKALVKDKSTGVIWDVPFHMLTIV